MEAQLQRVQAAQVAGAAGKAGAKEARVSLASLPSPPPSPAVGVFQALKAGGNAVIKALWIAHVLGAEISQMWSQHTTAVLLKHFSKKDVHPHFRVDMRSWPEVSNSEGEGVADWRHKQRTCLPSYITPLTFHIWGIRTTSDVVHMRCRSLRGFIPVMARSEEEEAKLRRESKALISSAGSTQELGLLRDMVQEVLARGAAGLPAAAEDMMAVCGQEGAAGPVGSPPLALRGRQEQEGESGLATPAPALALAG
jgi:hypothetical protein